MSLAVDEKGRAYVLDQVNERVVRRGPSGEVEGSVPLKLTAPQDIALGKNGMMAVMDRLADKAIALYDEGGALRGQLPLPGEGVAEPGLVTALVIDGDDVYVEREHGPLVRVGDTSGRPAEPRVEIPGRPSRDGLSYLSAGITEAATGRVYVSSIDRATNEHRFTRELRLKAEVYSIVLLDSDKKGTIYFAAEVAPQPEAPVVVLTCLEPKKGVPTGSAVLPANTMPDETFRDLTVLDEGGVLYAVRSEAGVSYQRYNCN